MHILYHHRTRGEDAQGIHIREILRAFRHLGHSTELVSFADRQRAEHEDIAAAPPALSSPSAPEGKTAVSSEARADAQQPASWLARMRSNALVYECAEIAYNVWGLWALWRAVRRQRPQVIYERYSLFNVSGVAISRLFGIPLVLEVNAPLAYEKERYEKLALRRLAYWSERWICSHSTATIVVSTPMREILVREGVPREHMSVISNGVNAEEIRDRLGRVDVRQQYGLQGKLVLGFVGWFKPWHRLDSVVELLASRADWRRSMHVLLVGDGPEAENLRRLSRKLGVEDAVTITGPVGRDFIYDHINAFDIALQPHVTEYASPMKIFEYLALGKCVVAPDLQNIREILTDGADSLLFAPRDVSDMARALTSLASDPQRVRCMGERAAKVIQERRYYWLDNARRALALVGLASPEEPAVAEREVIPS